MRARVARRARRPGAPIVQNTVDRRLNARRQTGAFHRRISEIRTSGAAMRWLHDDRSSSILHAVWTTGRRARFPLAPLRHLAVFL
jgi:hypothetical protein